MIVDADEPELTLVRRLFAELAGGDALDLAVAVEDRLRRLHVVAGEEAAAAWRRADVAESRSPRHRRIQRACRHCVDRRREAHDVVTRLESKFLARAQTGRVLELEDDRSRAPRVASTRPPVSPDTR